MRTNCQKEMRSRACRCGLILTKGMGILELQVFDKVTVSPWPAEIWLPEVAATTP